MAKLMVKDPKTGNTRPMTQKSYDHNKKRGWKIVGHEEEKKSIVQQEMDRLRAEKASKEQSGADLPAAEETESEQPTPAERKRPGPKPKSKAE